MYTVLGIDLRNCFHYALFVSWTFERGNLDATTLILGGKVVR